MISDYKQHHHAATGHHSNKQSPAAVTASKLAGSSRPQQAAAGSSSSSCSSSSGTRKQQAQQCWHLAILIWSGIDSHGSWLLPGTAQTNRSEADRNDHFWQAHDIAHGGEIGWRPNKRINAVPSKEGLHLLYQHCTGSVCLQPASTLLLLPPAFQSFQQLTMSPKSTACTSHTD